MEGRIVQALLLAASAAVIGGSLVVEFYIAPRYRRWRVRRRHRHAAELLRVYRSLRRKLRERRLAAALQVISAMAGEGAVVVANNNGQIAVLVPGEAILAPSFGNDN